MITPRRILFWIHLTIGCLVGIVVLVMSVTGFLLAYKRQVISWSDRGFVSQPGPGARLPLEELLAKVQAAQGRLPSGVTVRSEPGAPVALEFGPGSILFVDPYTALVLGEESTRLHGFFTSAENVHRWLGTTSANRPFGRSITGAVNLGFLFLLITGPVLWWPKQWTWTSLRKITVLRTGTWGRARDWNWHNTLGCWCVVPLFLIVVTGVIMSYAWANNLLYRISGNEPPPQGSTTSLARPTSDSRSSKESTSHNAKIDGLGKLLARAQLQVPDWRTISIRLPITRQGEVTFSMDRGNGGHPDLRSQLTLNVGTGAVVGWEPFSTYNRGRQWRSWARFMHTGEAFGILGQTIAAMASAGASLLVFTGLSLAIRRLTGRLTAGP